MNSREFQSFEEEWPAKNKWIIVTNNIEVLNSHGEMSHVWMTTFITEIDGYIATFDDAERRITNLTHWKYA